MKRIVIVSLIISTLFSGIVLAIIHYEQKKIAVVDIIKVVNDFTMKKELENHNAKEMEKIEFTTDSLKNLLQAKSSEKESSKEDLQKLYNLYMQSQQQQELQYESISNEINVQVWKRLNPLIDDYGKKENLRIMIGANGMGTVLYNDDFYDHTNNLIKFVNTMYEKGN